MFVVKLCRNLKPNENPLEWNKPGQQTFACFCRYVSVFGASVLYHNICHCVINGYMLVWCKQKLVWIEICLLNLSQKTSLHTICVADKLMEQIQTKWQTTRCKNIWVSLDLSMMLWWSFWLTFLIEIHATKLETLCQINNTILFAQKTPAMKAFNLYVFRTSKSCNPKNQEFEQQGTTMILMSLTIFNSIHAALCLPIFALAGRIQRKIIWEFINFDEGIRISNMDGLSNYKGS